MEYKDAIEVSHHFISTAAIFSSGRGLRWDWLSYGWPTWHSGNTTPLTNTRFQSLEVRCDKFSIPFSILKRANISLQLIVMKIFISFMKKGLQWMPENRRQEYHESLQLINSHKSYVQ
jgi:hypothetical protein